MYHSSSMLFADYYSYIGCQERVSQAYRDIDHWTRMSFLKAARISKFSCDRSIQHYDPNIWQTDPVAIELEEYIQASVGLKVER